jgi:hypothetical protein
MSTAKPIQVKPSFYAYNYYALKEIALKYGYNLVLHGSLNRDLDLIAIPWQPDIRDFRDMLKEFADYLGGSILQESEEDFERFRKKYHGRECHVINLNRKCEMINDVWTDAQWYVDISIIPAQNVQVSDTTKLNNEPTDSHI